MSSLEPYEEEPGTALDALPGLARVAAYAALHTTEWSVKTSARAWLRVGRAITKPDEAAALARDATRAANVFGELARSVSSGVPVARALMSAGQSLGGLVENPEVVNGSAGRPPTRATVPPGPGPGAAAPLARRVGHRQGTPGVRPDPR